MNLEKMILENEKLIYLILNKYQLNKEDYFDLGIIALIKGLKTYDPTKGFKLSTYLCKCIQNEIFRTLRKKRPITISLETEVEENITLNDILTNNYDFTEDLEKKEILIKVLKCLSSKEKDIIIKYYGLFNSRVYSQNEIAKLYNTTQETISRTIKKIIIKMRKEAG